MDKKHITQSWVGNMYQRFNAVYQEVDEFVNKETIRLVETHMQTVGETVKKFYSEVVQDLLLPPLMETCKSPVVVKDNNTNKGSPVEEDDEFINNISDNDIQVHLNSSKSNKETILEQTPCEDLNSPKNKNSSEEEFTIDDKSSSDDEKISCESLENFLDDNTSSKSDDSVFEDANWGIENIIEEKIQFLEEKKEESLFKLPEKSYDSSPTGYCSASSHDLSSCESFTALDSTRFAFSNFALYGETTQTYEQDGSIVDFEDLKMEQDGSIVDFEDPKMDTIDLTDKKEVVESCVVVEGKKVFSFPYMSRRSMSYKKIIKDAFTSRRRLTKEYKQLALWCGDIDKELGQKTEQNAIKIQLQDFPDSEWELL